MQSLLTRIPLHAHRHYPGLLITDDDKTNVVGKEVNAVVARDGDRDLELAWQKLGAVDRLWGILKVGAKHIGCTVCCHLGILLVHRHKLLAIEPDVVVGARLRCQEVCDVIGKLLSIQIVGPVLVWRAGSHDIAVHIATCAQRRTHIFYHSREHGLQVVLQHSVQLIRLTSGKAQCAVAILMMVDKANMVNAI